MLLLALAVPTLAAVALPGGPWPSPKLQKRGVVFWGRRYEFGSSVLPSTIVSRNENILAAPMSLRLVSGGRERRWTSAAFKPLRCDAETARYETSASAGGLRVRLCYATEFDGVTWVDVELHSPHGCQIGSLDLVIPLKPKYATLFHHSSVYPIHVWDWPKRQMNSGAVPKAGLNLPFVFHIWLGNDDRGIQFFAESDEALSPADPRSVFRLTPGSRASVLTLSLLANYGLRGTWRCTIGFVATPVKPYPQSWREVHYCQMAGYGIERSTTDGQPARIDILKWTGVNWLGFHESWSDEQSLPRPKKPDDLRSLVEACRERAMRLAVYTGCYMATRSPEYTADWDVLPIGDHYQYQRPDNGDICRVTCSNTGYPALLLKTYERAFREYGLGGLYLDGLTCPLPCTNTKHGCGYLGRDGQVHPTMPIRRTRELMKALFRVVKSEGRSGLIISHTSSSILLPALSFADAYLDGEHLLSYLRLGSHEYPEAVLRAEMCGHNFGIPGTQLPVRGDEAQMQRARTLCLLYDILMIWHPEHQADIWRAFDSFGAARSEWLSPNRARQIATVVSGGEIRVSAYLRKGRGVLLVIANLGEKEASATLAVNRKGLGAGRGDALTARDEESGGDIGIKADRITLGVNPNAFRMVSIHLVKETQQTR